MKKSFTLIELIISIVIFSLLVYFMSSVLSQIRVNKSFFKKELSKSVSKDNFVKTIYNDVLKSTSISLQNTQNKKYIILYLHTYNSLYSIAKPYVVWYVSKKGNTIMRLESPEKIQLPLKGNERYYLDKFVQNVKIFKIYSHKEKYFIFVKAKKNIYFEMYKGY